MIKDFFNFNKKELPEIIKDASIIKLVTNDVKVENFHKILQYICKDIDFSIVLTRYSGDKLQELFGRHNYTYRG